MIRRRHFLKIALGTTGVVLTAACTPAAPTAPSKPAEPEQAKPQRVPGIATVTAKRKSRRLGAPRRWGEHW